MDAIEPFTAEGFRFVDFLDAPLSDIAEARTILWRVLQGDIFNALRPGTSLCKTRLDASVDRDGNITTVRVDDGCNPTLGIINLVVYRGRGSDVAGLFNLYNVRPDPLSRDPREFNAAAMPAFRPTDKWGDVMAWILENDLVENGRRFDLVRWEHPSLPAQRWIGDPVCDFAIDRLIMRGHKVRRRSDGSPSDTQKKVVGDSTGRPWR